MPLDEVEISAGAIAYFDTVVLIDDGEVSVSGDR